MAPPLLVLRVLPWLWFRPAPGSEMTWMTSQPPPASLPPLFFSPTPLVREEYWGPCLNLSLHQCFYLVPILLPPLGMTFILAMLEWKSNHSEVLAGFSEDTCYFFFIVWAAKILHIYWVTMVDKWDGISLVLEWEKKFQEAMRAEVGTTSFHTTNSSMIELPKVFTGTGIIAQDTARKEPKF